MTTEAKPTREQLMARLRELQATIDHDILTGTARYSDDQLKAHVERAEGHPLRFAEASTLAIFRTLTRRRR